MDTLILKVGVCFYATWKSIRSEILQRCFVRFAKVVCFFNKKRACKLARDIKSSNVNYSTLELIRLCI